MRTILKAMKHFVWRRIIRFRLMVTTRGGVGEYHSILVVAPHPDDEIIGLGGYLIRHVRSGKRLTIVYLTDGEKSLEDIAPEKVSSERRALSSCVHARLALVPEQVLWCGFPDGAIPRKGSTEFAAAVERFGEVIGTIDPDAVFVTHLLDTWPFDHVAAFEIVSAAIRKKALGCDLYGYWVWLWYSMPLKSLLRLNWRNISRIPVHGELREKLVLTDMYLKPMAPNGKPWSGVLPKAMTDAFRYPYEVVEKF